MSRPTERDLQLLNMPTIASQMPVTFENGSVWDGFKGECQGCGKTLPDADLRGAVVRHGKSMAAIEASGVCRECLLLTRFVYRLHDDRRITGPRGNRWLTWELRPKGFLGRIRSIIGM